MKSIENVWNSMKIMKTLGFHENLWKIMKINVNQWKRMKTFEICRIHAKSTKPMRFIGNLWNIHEIPWIQMKTIEIYMKFHHWLFFIFLKNSRDLVETDENQWKPLQIYESIRNMWNSVKINGSKRNSWTSVQIKKEICGIRWKSDETHGGSMTVDENINEHQWTSTRSLWTSIKHLRHVKL